MNQLNDWLCWFLVESELNFGMGGFIIGKMKYIWKKMLCQLLPDVKAAVINISNFRPAACFFSHPLTFHVEKRILQIVNLPKRSIVFFFPPINHWHCLLPFSNTICVCVWVYVCVCVSVCVCECVWPQYYPQIDISSVAVVSHVRVIQWRNCSWMILPFFTKCAPLSSIHFGRITEFCQHIKFRWIVD